MKPVAGPQSPIFVGAIVVDRNFMSAIHG